MKPSRVGACPEPVEGKPSGTNGKAVTGETIMMAPAAGFYTNHELGKTQVRLAYVLCKEDIQRALLILSKAIEEYNALSNET